jgi:hypothetical protein
LNVLALIALLISAFSDFISPFRGILFSYFRVVFPFIFLLNLALFVVWLFTKQWKLAGLNFLVFLVCIGAHTYFPIHRKTKDIPSGCIKILTYNVMRFGQKDVQSKKESKKIVQYICDNDADIVCIQEYGVSRNNGDKTLLEKDINAAFGAYSYPCEIFGIVVFSKFPVLSVTKAPYASAYNGSVMYELNVHGKKVTLINNHLESNKLSQEERNNYYRMTLDMDSRSL